MGLIKWIEYLSGCSRRQLLRKLKELLAERISNGILLLFEGLLPVDRW